MAKWLYKQTEPGLFTVGYYAPDDSWNPESDHDSRDGAAARVHYLNGGQTIKEAAAPEMYKALVDLVSRITSGAPFSVEKAQASLAMAEGRV